ncbi:hypothetical protein BJ170DRAFT_277435 [Xylariales sp. AK1849]|nr:hypothetical protein BJ170DRAFT_277435 [Xylariales sp. AK1849]
MGCGTKRKTFEVRPEQKWDYISLGDFKANSCLTPFAYTYLFLSLFISIAVYSVDTFTAVNLLAFGKWSSQIEPTTLIPFDVSKWIFAICIIASFVNLAFEHIRAMRVMKRGSVAESYLDNLAVRLESVRPGRGQGFRRFLVFAELTKSKKGAEYVALFTYFSFQSWIRVIFCSGPRQVVNALTLYAVYTSELIPTDAGSVDVTILNFFRKIGKLATEDYQTAAVLSGMLFTLVIWVISFLFLIVATLFFVFFLWHYIPRQDGGLSGYCERKINKRLMKIVSVKVNKAIAKEEQQRVKAELRAAKKAGEKPPSGRQATLPTIPDVELGKSDSLPEMPMLNRNDTMATLPLYTSRPGTPGSIELSALDQKRPTMPSRSGTTTTLASQSSYSSQAPLMGGAAGMGFSRSASPAPSLPNVDLNNYPPMRPGTSQSNRSFGQGPGFHRVQTSNSSNSGFGPLYTQSPAPYSSERMPDMSPPVRSPTANSMDSYGGRPTPRPGNQFGARPGPPGRPVYDDNMSGRSSPAPSTYSNRGPPMSGPYNGPGPGPLRSPMRSTTGPVPLPQRQQFQPQPQRNMTAPLPQMQDDFISRPGTAASQRSMPRPGYGNGYNGEMQGQRGPPRW